MFNKQICVVILSAVIFAFTITSVFAQSNSPDTAANQRSLVFATTDNGPIAVDRLLYTALRNIRYNVDFVTPIVREGFIQSNEGTVDGVIAGYPNLHTVYTNLRRVPVPLERINVRVFAREGSQLRINSWSELAGLHVGILVNRTYILERLPRNVTITEKQNNRAVLDGLITGEYDVAVLVERDHETLGERLNITRIGDVDLLTEYLYLNQRHEALIPYIASSLERLFNDGTADDILNDLPFTEVSNKKTVLHIISTSIELDREDQFMAELRRPFEDDMSIEWMTLNLDARRFTRGQFSIPLIASLLRGDLITKNVFAVIVSGDTALEFVKDYYYLYFRNIPVLFYGVSERYSEIIRDNEHHYYFTGIVKTIETEETVDMALKIFPKTNNIFVVNDFTAEGNQYRNAMTRSLESYKDRFNIEYNENMDAAALLEQINNLPHDSLLLVGSFFVDANHQYYTLSESKRLLERNSNVPIISFYSTDVAFNAIGGKALDYERYGQVIADMLKQLLNGRSVEEIPIIENSADYNRWVFDQIQMNNFNINKRVLPPGSQIINGRPVIWEANPEFFVAMIILLLVSVLLIIGICVFLIVNHKHNSLKDKLQHELTLEKSMLEIIFDSVPEILFVKDLNHTFMRVNKQFEDHFGCQGDVIIGRKGYDNKFLAAIVDDFMETEQAVIKENRLIMLEKCINGVKGTSPFFEIIASPLHDNLGKVIGIVGVAYDVTHRKRMEEAAQAASRAKSNFLANMSHEMRTPLTAVLGLTELTLETIQLDDETHSNLVKVYRSGETILNLVNDILDISKIEADRMELNPIKYDVPSLLNDTITQSILYIDEKPIELVLDINEDLPNYLYGDELRIKQILNNLLSNAFKFTKEGKVELGVRYEREDETIWLTAWVKDTGIGIRPEDMSKLFTLYGKMEDDISKNKSNRRTEGTGLGLSIAKKVAEMMGGSINVESEYGKGSTFTIKIKQKYVSDDRINIDVVKSLKNFNYTKQKFDGAKMTRINLMYAHVLIVDDNSTNLDVAKGLMSLYGMKIDCVTGGQQGIDAIKDEKVKYDAIFMDHMMPDINGVEATRIIREEINTDYARNIPIIALTANAILGNEEMFLSKGFQAFIAKPIDLTRLDVVLRQWVRNKDKEALLENKTITIEARRGKYKQTQNKTISGLDMEKGIIRFGYNEDAYYKVLQSFSVNTRPLLETVKNVNIDNLEKYSITVHGIKGSSRGIFAEEIGDLAEALENAAIINDFDFIKENNERFLNMIQTLLINIENELAKSGIEQKPKKEKPDNELLLRLHDACINYDIDEMDKLTAAIENFEYTADDGLALWLRQNLDQGKYQSIKMKLSEIVKKEE